MLNNVCPTRDLLFCVYTSLPMQPKIFLIVMFWAFFFSLQLYNTSFNNFEQKHHLTKRYAFPKSIKKGKKFQIIRTLHFKDFCKFFLRIFFIVYCLIMGSTFLEKCIYFRRLFQIHVKYEWKTYYMLHFLMWKTFCFCYELYFLFIKQIIRFDPIKKGNWLWNIHCFFKHGIMLKTLIKKKKTTLST